MNNKALTLSVIMAVLAFVMVQSYVSSIEEGAKAKFGTEVNVVKAKRDIKEMETINETMLEMAAIPKRFLEPAALSFIIPVDEKDKDEALKSAVKSMKTLSGTIALVPVKKGEQLTYNKITEPSMRTGLAPQVSPGKRAVSVPVTDITGVSKLVKPGDRVDLIAVTGQRENKIAKTILQDTVVLAVGRSVTNNPARLVELDPFGGKDNRIKNLSEDSSFGAITIEVDPIQAQMMALLALASDSQIMVSLRNNDDSDRQNVPGTMLSDVLGADVVRIRAPATLPGGTR